jgi:AraC-like DNA-binding protein
MKGLEPTADWRDVARHPFPSEGEERPMRILIVDDHALVRRGIGHVVKEGERRVRRRADSSCPRAWSPRDRRVAGEQADGCSCLPRSPEHIGPAGLLRRAGDAWGRLPGCWEWIATAADRASQRRQPASRVGIVSVLRVEAESPTTGGSVSVNRLLESLIADALHDALDGQSGPASAKAIADPGIVSTLAAIHERPEDSWTIGELSRLSAMSRSAFSARFRSVVGETPMRYVTTIRLARAARLLRSTDETIAEIATRTGYASESALSRAFKDRFGEAPGEFRRRRRT